ncbi:phage holin, LLH family [Siminovitchia sp. 179-K 8D1 HS]|uniref:phage holin, LLH family n=1 Tax=Siminovitchia sp. 179-K 8D1 HS TaxID=3142385 RepID=UPI00399F4F9D
MEAIQAELISAAIGIIVTCIGIVSGYTAKFLKEKFGLEKLERSKAYAKIAVDFAEQVGIDFKAEEKFDTAKKHLLLMLNNNNIKMSEDELEGLIEAMVAEMNRSFKKELDERRVAEQVIEDIKCRWS